MLPLKGKIGQNYGLVLLSLLISMNIQLAVGQSQPQRRISRVLTIEMNPNYKRHRIPLGIFQSMTSRPNVMLQFDGGPAGGIRLQPSLRTVTLQGPRRINRKISVQTNRNGEVILDILPDASVRVRKPSVPKIPTFSGTAMPTTNFNQNIGKKQNIAKPTRVVNTDKSNQEISNSNRPTFTQTQRVRGDNPQVNGADTNKLLRMNTANVNSISKNNRKNSKNLAALSENNSKHALLKHRERHIESRNPFNNGLPEIFPLSRPDTVNNGNFESSGMFLLTPESHPSGHSFPHDMLPFVDPDAEPTMIEGTNSPFMDPQMNQRVGDGGITLPDHLRDILPPIQREHHQQSENNPNNLDMFLGQRLIESMEGLHNGRGPPSDAVINNPGPPERSLVSSSRRNTQQQGERNAENRQFFVGDGEHNFFLQQESNFGQQQRQPLTNRHDIPNEEISNVLTGISNFNRPPPIIIADNSISAQNTQRTQNTDIRNNIKRVHQTLEPTTQIITESRQSHNFKTQNRFNLGNQERTTADGISNVKNLNEQRIKNDNLPELFGENSQQQSSNRPTHTHFMKDVVDPRSLEGIFHQHFMGEADNPLADNPLFLNNQPKQVMLTRTGLIDVSDNTQINRNIQLKNSRTNMRSPTKSTTQSQGRGVVKTRVNNDFSNGFQTSNTVSETSLPTIGSKTTSSLRNMGIVARQPSLLNKLTKESEGRQNSVISKNKMEIERKVPTDTIRENRNIDNNRNIAPDSSKRKISSISRQETLLGKRTGLQNIDNPRMLSDSLRGQSRSQKRTNASSKQRQIKKKSDIQLSKTLKRKQPNERKDVNDNSLKKDKTVTSRKSSQQETKTSNSGFVDKSGKITREEIKLANKDKVSQSQQKPTKDIKSTNMDVVDISGKTLRSDIQKSNTDLVVTSRRISQNDSKISNKTPLVAEGRKTKIVKEEHMTNIAKDEQKTKIAKEEQKQKSKSSDKKKSSSPKSNRKSKKSKRKRKKSKSKKRKSKKSKKSNSEKKLESNTQQ